MNIMDKKNQKFELYHIQDYFQVEKLFLDFAKKFTHGSVVDSRGIFDLVGGLQDEINNKDIKHPEWPLKQKLISRIDINLFGSLDTADQKEALMQQLQFVCAFMRIYTEVQVYDKGKVVPALATGKIDFSLPYSLREYMHDSEGRDVAFE